MDHGHQTRSQQRKQDRLSHQTAAIQRELGPESMHPKVEAPCPLPTQSQAGAIE